MKRQSSSPSARGNKEKIRESKMSQWRPCLLIFRSTSCDLLGPSHASSHSSLHPSNKHLDETNAPAPANPSSSRAARPMCRVGTIFSLQGMGPAHAGALQLRRALCALLRRLRRPPRAWRRCNVVRLEIAAMSSSQPVYASNR